MDFTFLTEDQIWGDDALDVMKKYGTAVATTDLTAILGGSCTSWTASSEDMWVRCVSTYGTKFFDSSQCRTISARPVLPPSEASKIIPSNARDINGVRVAEYGEYPQTVADDETSEKLERLHKEESLRLTGKNYTFDMSLLRVPGIPFSAESYSEYEMDGKRYIRVHGQCDDGDNKLSTGERVEPRKPYWVEVQPIEWLMDRSGTMVAKKCLFAGIQFDAKGLYYGDFSKTSMKHYLDTYFAKEMEPIERVANREKSENNENSEMITSKISLLRAVVAPNVSKEKGVVNPKMSAKEKLGRLNKAAQTLLGAKVKDITD